MRMDATEVLNLAQDFGPGLRVGELLTGTPTAVCTGTGHPTVDNVGLNGSDVVVGQRTYPANTLVEFQLTGDTAGSYPVVITAESDAANSQTLVEKFTIQVV